MAAKLVTCTNVNQEKASRYDIVNWVNASVGTQYTKIEQLASGAAYCRLVEMLWPGAVPLKRVKMDTVHEHEFIENFKMVQSAFTKRGIDTWMPIEKLVKARFQDNYEFAQWFKKFFDTNYSGQPVQVIAPVASSAPAHRPAPPKAPVAAAAAAPAAAPAQRSASLRTTAPQTRSPPKQSEPGMTVTQSSNGTDPAAQQRLRELEARVAQQDATLREMEHLRTFYFTKLRLVEIAVQQSVDSGEKMIEAQRVLDILYAESHPEAADLENGEAEQQPAGDQDEF